MIRDWAGFIHAVCPQANEDIVDGIEQAMPTLAEQAKLTTKKRVCHWVGQNGVESQHFTRLSENLTYTTAARLMKVWPSRFHSVAEATPYLRNPKALAEKVYGDRMGNRAGSGDGYMYRGGGLIMVTGRDGYRRFGFEDKPEELRSMPGALLASVGYWTTHKLNGPADRDDYKAVTRGINGGLTDYAERVALTKKAARLIDRFWESEEPEDDAVDEVALLAPGTPKVDTGGIKLSRERLAGVQKRLIEIGYREVGKVDGLWGGRTAGAVVAFKNDRGLKPLNATTDAAFLQALSEPFIRPVSAERATATATTLAAEGSVIAKQGLRQKAWAWLTGAGATVYGAVSGASDYWSDAQGYVGQAKGLLTSVPDWVWIAAALGIAYFLWTSADKTLAARVEDERTGKTA